MTYKLKSKERGGFVDVIPPCSPDLSCGMIWVRRNNATDEQAVVNHMARADVNAWMLTGPAHGWLDYEKWREMMAGQGWALSWQGHSILLDIYSDMNSRFQKQIEGNDNKNEDPDSL